MGSLLEKIQKHPLFYNDQPVVTLAMVDELHQRVKGTAKRNFGRNRKRFIEDQHFWEINSQDEIRSIKESGLIADSVKRSVILLSEKGYLKLVKSFTDDLSWEIQDKLIDCYFRVKKVEQKTQAFDAQQFGEMLQQAGAVIKSQGEIIQTQSSAIASQGDAISKMASNAAAIMSFARWHRAPNPNQQPLPFPKEQNQLGEDRGAGS